MNPASGILLWLLVLSLGVAFGAGLYEHRIVVPRWMRSSADSGAHWDGAAAREDDTGRRFWGFATTGPLTLLTVANLVAAWQSSEAVRGWWLVAAVTALADRVFTFAYFIPAMVRLMRSPDSPESVARARRWGNWNYLRHALVLAAWLASLRAFALFYAHPG